MKRLACLAAGALCFIAAAASAQDDQIFGATGVPQRGVIQSVSPTEIVMSINGVDRPFDVHQIKKVVFEGEPGELRRAREDVAEGRYEDAKAELGKIDTSTIGRDIVKDDITFYSAYAEGKLALAGSADKKKAFDKMLDFATKNSRSFHFYDAAELVGDLAIARGESADAARYYGALSKAPWPDYKLRADVLSARALVLTGDEAGYKQAMARYEEVINSPLSTPEANAQKASAEVGKAFCMVHLGKAMEAEQVLRRIISENDPQSQRNLFGRAYNALGAAEETQGNVKDALLAYLHTDLLFYHDPEVHAEALYHLAKLWGDPKINQPERAADARNLLKNSYSGTLWAQKS